VTDREPHVSDLRWDRLLAGELPDDARDAAHAHAAACASCGARLRELTAEREAFKLRPVGFALRAPARRPRWWWGAPLAALAAVAAVVVIVRAPTAPGERTKGDAIKLLLSAGRPGELVPLAAGDTIQPGDYVQAGYSAPRAGFGAVLALDGAGAALAYVPASGATMIALPAGTERSFPQSTVLDDVVGRELIVVLWCDRAHALGPLLDELRTTRQVAAPAGCASRAVALDKRAPR